MLSVLFPEHAALGPPLRHLTESFQLPLRPAACLPLPPTAHPRPSCDKCASSHQLNDEETLNGVTTRDGDQGSRASLRAEDGDATLVEAARVLLGGDLEVDREDEVCPGEVQVDGQGHLEERTGARRWLRPTAPTGPRRPQTAEGATYHVSLSLGVGLLDPAQLRQRKDRGDGVGQRQLVVTARGPLELQACGRQSGPVTSSTGHVTPCRAVHGSGVLPSSPDRERRRKGHQGHP